MAKDLSRHDGYAIISPLEPGDATFVMNPSKASKSEAPDEMTFWQTVGSVLAAFFGVQSSARRKRDFSRGKPLAFIAVALLLTALFVLALFTLVRVIVHQAAG